MINNCYLPISIQIRNLDIFNNQIHVMVGYLIYSINLSEEIINQYKNDGAVLLKGVFEKHWINLIEEGISR